MRIGFAGAHGVGKTVLSNILQEFFPDHKRYVNIQRAFKYFFKDKFDITKNRTYESQIIISSHYVSELILNPNLIADRTLYDVYGYTYCSKNISVAEANNIRRITEDALKLYDKIFYIPIEFPIKDDGIREQDENYRHQIDLEIKKWLDYYKYNYITLKGTVEQREKLLKYELKN